MRWANLVRSLGRLVLVMAVAALFLAAAAALLVGAWSRFARAAGLEPERPGAAVPSAPAPPSGQLAVGCRWTSRCG